MANTSAIGQQAAHTTHQLSSPSCSTRAMEKSLTLNEKYLSFLEKKLNKGVNDTNIMQVCVWVWFTLIKFFQIKT